MRFFRNVYKHNVDSNAIKKNMLHIVIIIKTKLSNSTNTHCYYYIIKIVIDDYILSFIKIQNFRNEIKVLILRKKLTYKATKIIFKFTFS